MTSAMVATQTAAASEGTISVNPTTKTLTITGAAGKAIYMVRSNIRDSALQKENLRFIDAPTQNSVSASVIQAAIERKEKDPRALIEEIALKNISKIGISKSLAPAVQAAKTYDPNDENNNTEVFLEFQDMDNEKLEPRTYVILASETEYNLWVNANDEFYNQDKDAFKTKAIAAGEKFIQGYRLVKHIYGEPSSKLYKGSVDLTLGEQGNMSDLSKCGDKINIMFFSMLNTNKPEAKIRNLNGFVNHADNYYDPDNKFSNNGRFLYIDSSLVLDDPGTLYTTMLHEFSHAISFNQKKLINKVFWTYWYGEMLAMLCEDMMQEYLGILDANVDPQDSAQKATALSASPKGRLSRANQLGGRYGLTGRGVEVYAEAFELGSWLARRFGGVKLIKELATNACVDWDSILNAVNKVNSTDHTIQSLLTLLAEDTLEQKTSSGHNQAAATYDGDTNLTYDNNGSKYLYPLTAIDLWNSNQFYDWYDADLASTNLVLNQTRPSSGVPSGNIYKKGANANVFVGPCLFKRNTTADIGPYGRISSKLTASAEDTVTLTFSCNATTFGDTLTIFVK